MQFKILEAILKLNPKAHVSMSGEDINTITWESGTPPIAKELILAKVAELQTEYEDNILQQKARKESAIAKLKALGLTEEEVKSIL